MTFDPEEVGNRIVTSVKAYVERATNRAIDPLLTRLATVETRVGALTMIAGRGASTDKIDGLESLIRRVADLEVRLKAVEERPTAATYRGVFTDGEIYKAGDFCTWRGGMWLCLQPSTRTCPGGSDGSWRLVVKSGRA